MMKTGHGLSRQARSSVRLALAAGLALAPAGHPARADPPATVYPPQAMSDAPCPPGRDGLWALDPRVLASDWPWLCRYAEENRATLAAGPVRAVFIGDSITEGWLPGDPDFFAHGFVDRGIGGQTSPQLLARFWPDVVALHPQVVHIMVGTNDIAGNTGPTSAEAWRNNLRAMVALARANGIAVVLGSILPADRFEWRPGLAPARQIVELNAWLAEFARAEGLVFADYHAALAGPDGELPPAYGPDGVHPNAQGYALMRPIAERAIAEAERASRGAGPAADK